MKGAYNFSLFGNTIYFEDVANYLIHLIDCFISNLKYELSSFERVTNNKDDRVLTG